MWQFSIRQFVNQFSKDTVGAGLAEYMLLLMLIALVVMTMVVPIGAWILKALQDVVAAFH